MKCYIEECKEDAIDQLLFVGLPLPIKENRFCEKHGKEYEKEEKFLGIFYVEGPNNFPITKFIDRFDICKYFPSYLRNKETWDKLKGHNINARQFDNVVTGKTDVINGLDYYYHTEDKEDNKDVNVKIEDQIITIDDLQINNIHQKTKQIEIDCAWNE